MTHARTGEFTRDRQPSSGLGDGFACMTLLPPTLPHLLPPSLPPHQHARRGRARAYSPGHRGTRPQPGGGWSSRCGRALTRPGGPSGRGGRRVGARIRVRGGGRALSSHGSGRVGARVRVRAGGRALSSHGHLVWLLGPQRRPGCKWGHGCGTGCSK